jgi:hypothetical protein
MSFGSFIDASSSAVLNEILSSTHDSNGMAFPSRYDVLFLPPSGTRGTGGVGASTNLFSQVLLGQVGGGDVRDVSYQCNSIEFPARTIDTTNDENMYGPARKIAQGYTYGDITGKFYCHNDMREKKFFETWQRLAYNPQTFAMGYYDDYVGTIQIFQLDAKGNRTYGCELIECFPNTIAAQQLDGTQAAGAQEISVAFSYRYWKNLTDEASLPKPLLERLQGVLANQVERKLLSRIPKVLSRL